MTDETDNREKRDGDRLDHPVLVAYRSVDRFLSDFGTNISRAGVFVNTRDPLPEGTPVRLLISLPDREPPQEILGRVARVQRPGGDQAPGMGIEFVGVSDEVREQLDQLVAELRRRLGQGSDTE